MFVVIVVIVVIAVFCWLTRMTGSTMGGGKVVEMGVICVMCVVVCWFVVLGSMAYDLLVLVEDTYDRVI